MCCVRNGSLQQKLLPFYINFKERGRDNQGIGWGGGERCYVGWQRIPIYISVDNNNNRNKVEAGSGWVFTTIKWGTVRCGGLWDRDIELTRGSCESLCIAHRLNEKDRLAIDDSDWCLSFIVCFIFLFFCSLGLNRSSHSHNLTSRYNVNHFVSWWQHIETEQHSDSSSEHKLVTNIDAQPNIYRQASLVSLVFIDVLSHPHTQRDWNSLKKQIKLLDNCE